MIIDGDSTLRWYPATNREMTNWRITCVAACTIADTEVASEVTDHDQGGPSREALVVAVVEGTVKPFAKRTRGPAPGPRGRA
ncbi:hypothetical protein GCM10009754_38670 [Amycolatopsis minnesotensis]|uniref:Uncharacterized protein n=1 Tax=Amycolatopsis minnesotensis TaxID=337894 RepID=A0ABP5CIC5_9PSEU